MIPHSDWRAPYIPRQFASLLAAAHSFSPKQYTHYYTISYTTLPVYDAVCKRVLSFTSKCVNSDCDLVSFSARHAVLYGCMSSPLGRSLWYVDIGCLLNPQFNHCSVVWNFYLSSTLSELLAKDDMLRDILLFRDHPNQSIGQFDTAEIATAIKCICTE